MTTDRLIELVNYIVNEPQSDERKIGYLFPFNACEILCSENVYVLNKIFDNSNQKEDAKHSFKNENEINEQEFSGRKSIMNPGNITEEKTDDDFNDLDRDIVDPDADSEENVENGCEKKEDKTEEVFKNLKDEVKEFLNSFESEVYVLSVSKEEIEIIENPAPPEYPVINQIFKLFQAEGKLNYVLAGYFYNFFNHLTLFRNDVFMTYLLQHKTSFIFDMIRHLNRKSISDCLIKIMVSNVPSIQDTDIKKQILDKVIDSFNQNDEEVKYLIM